MIGEGKISADFIALMQQQIGEEETQLLLNSLNTPSPVSIRINDSQNNPTPNTQHSTLSNVPWCPQGFYLKERPQFIFDPLLHAGAYYVQEASSMFVSYAIRKLRFCDDDDNDDDNLPSGRQSSSSSSSSYKTLLCLDLCAAPGGKSTILINDLPEGSTIITNEINRKRAWILHENISKWMSFRDDFKTQAIVTNNAPKDFQKLGEGIFDLILCDAPCSGEGMFRKEEDAVKMWNMQNVELCWKRQREIVSDIWRTLRESGYMIYSTCTYNHFEDEDNVRWICDELGGEVIDLNVPEEWNITGKGMYHFYPHRVQGEGFFCAVIKKHGIYDSNYNPNGQLNTQNSKLNTKLKVLPLRTFDSTTPRYEVTREEALHYLHGDVLHLSSDAPKGELLITYEHHPLGLVKNIGTRANNLYPKEWRIRLQV